MKVVINSDYGGFSLSDEAIEAYADRKGITLRKEERNSDSVLSSDYYLDNDEWFNCREIKRSDSDLVAVVESLGEKANGFCATLKVVEIPEDVDWYVEEYDGNEWVAEKHRTWM
jgi:ABC-type transporter Mla MlaB component